MAAQLLSNTKANAIRRSYSLGFQIYKPAESAEFIQLVNDWFDVMNSNMNTFSYSGKVIIYFSHSTNISNKFFL